MRIYIDNKEYITDSDIIFLNDVIQRYKGRNDGVTAFVNQTCVPRSEWDKRMIREDDNITVIFAKP
ncbi:MAG: MoaD/ThiS family protein [Muribaculaceae bacterium]|nr:MoaD/ThiS family protein [Muribaculaceae bacterium]